MRAVTINCEFSLPGLIYIHTIQRIFPSSQASGRVHACHASAMHNIMRITCTCGTVEPPNKGYTWNGSIVLCSEVVLQSARRGMDLA